MAPFLTVLPYLYDIIARERHSVYEINSVQLELNELTKPRAVFRRVVV
jgi:hypothetical protein